MKTIRATVNTGQSYSPEGQIVHLEFVPDKIQLPIDIEFGDVEGLLHFYDETRGLWGTYSVSMIGVEGIDRKGIVLEMKQDFMRMANGMFPYLDITFDDAKAIKARIGEEA